MARAGTELYPVWAYALYTPYARLSDWFRSESTAPQPHAWANYRTREMELCRMYVGDMSAHERATFFRLANLNVRGHGKCKTSAQARYRAAVLAENLAFMLADVPSIGPGE